MFRERKNILLDGAELEGLMKRAGFVDVTSRRIKIEIGSWGKGLTPFLEKAKFFLFRSCKSCPCREILQDLDVGSGSTCRADAGVCPEWRRTCTICRRCESRCSKPGLSIVCLYVPLQLLKSLINSYVVTGRKPNVEILLWPLRQKLLHMDIYEMPSGSEIPLNHYGRRICRVE